MKRASIGLLLAAALLVGAPGAGAAKSRDVQSTGVASGQIVMSWHGDPARGCAAMGVCDVSGMLVYQPDAVDMDGRLTGSGHFVPQDVDLDSFSPAPVRVHRGTSAVCVDTVDTSTFFLTANRVGKTSRYSFGRPQELEGDSGGFSSGRCAGPLTSELTGVFPTGTLDAAPLARHSSVLDLTGRKTFSAGPFSGETISTLTARISRAGSSDSGEFIDSFGPSKTRKFRLLELDASYRMTLASGSLITNFAGTSDPFCRPLDSCGSRGVDIFSVPATTGEVSIVAHRILHKHEHASLALALRDLRAGRLSVEGLLDIQAPNAPTHISSNVTRGDGSSCVDSNETGPPVDLRVARQSARLDVTLSDSADGLRTHCEGPSERDVVHEASLATGSMSVGDVTKRSLQLRLVPSPSFESAGYAGSRTGAIVLDLQRTRLHVSVGRLVSG